MTNPLTLASHQCEEVFNLSQEEYHSEKDDDISSSELSEESRGEYKAESDDFDPNACPECPYCSVERHAILKAKQGLGLS